MTCIAPVTFPPERLRMIAEREQAHGHFWHAPRRALLLDTVERLGLPAGAAVLDVGCGTGALVDALAQRGFAAHGLDPFAAASGLDPARFRTGQAEAIAWPDASFDAACAFDVLEHADDARALDELFRVVRPGGRLVVSVPAHAWLWSARDTLAGHRRRYTRRSLRACVATAGFAVERLFGFQCLLLPLLAASRLWARVAGREHTHAEDAPGRAANAVLRTVNALEVGAGRRLRPPTGSSLVLVARKP